MSYSIQQLVLASSNEGKLKELNAQLKPLDIEVLPQSAFDISDADETGTTFIENALIKAKHATSISGLPALADDSGLVVPALGGNPGVYSARFAGEPRSDAKNNDKLLSEMTGVTNRHASFVCVMALCFSEKHPLPIIAQGIWHGSITESLHGEDGFGYDPLFYVPTHNVTSAQLQREEKNKISHRGQALQSLLAQLQLLSS